MTQFDSRKNRDIERHTKNNETRARINLMNFEKSMSSFSSEDKIIRIKTVRSDQLEFERHGFSLGTNIGCGAFATVKTAVYSKSTADHDDQYLRLACKIIDKARTSMDYLTKFLPRELDILKQINHPSIIQVHSIFQRKQKIYIFMQNAEHGDLFQFIKINGPVKESCAKIWFGQIASAIRYLHSVNIVHRDLKCENILLSRHMNAKVSDFGFAKICDGPLRVGDTHTMLELSRTYCGSIAYAAPEILQNLPYDPRVADVWSMGVILFIMLFAAMPYDDQSFSIIIREQKERKLHSVKTIEMKLSRSCKKLYRSLLEPDLVARAKLDDISQSSWLRKYCRCN